jgi:fucose permease
MDFSGITGDPKTTVAGAGVIVMTLALIFHAVDMQTWLAVSGFLLGGGLVLTNSAPKPPAA